MYRWQKLTQAQRDDLVALRQAHDRAWHRPDHPDLGKGWYLITAATYQHRHHFTEPNELTALVKHLLIGLATRGIPLSAWVVLPNHYHLLVDVESSTKLGPVLGPIHGRSAHYANKRDQTPGRQVWYKYSDRKVRDERHFWTCVHYIAMNPVKHHWAATADEWPWSSYHTQLEQFGVQWMDDLRREYPLLEMGSGWDDGEARPLDH